MPVKSFVLLALMAGLTPLAAEKYHYKGQHLEVYIKKAKFQPRGYVEGKARITVKAKDEKGSFNCNIRISRKRQPNKKEFDLAPLRVESLKACNKWLKLNNKRVFIGRMLISGSDSFHKLKKLSYYLFQGKARLKINGKKIEMNSPRPMNGSWGEGQCFELTTFNSKLRVKVGPLTYPQGKIQLRQKQLEISNYRLLDNKQNPSRIRYDRDEKNCTLFKLATGMQKAQKLGFK